MTAMVVYGLIVVATGCGVLAMVSSVLSGLYHRRQRRYWEAREGALGGCPRCLAALERDRERAVPCDRHHGTLRRVFPDFR